MKLPKLYAPVKVKFWSLRAGFGDGYGVIFDIDTEVERTIVRVRDTNSWDGSGWKWQIQHLSRLIEWDWSATADQEVLDNHGSELEFTYV